MPRASDVTKPMDKVELKVTTASPSVVPGGRLDVLVLLRNKTSEPVELYFTGDPTPRFDIEAVDAKGRRVDLPAGRWPGYPKGFKPEAREAKASRITLDRNGTARLKLAWDAVKTKWAPDKARTWEGRGHPRTTAGPLPVGKYTLRVILPMVGEIDAPKISVEVGS